MKPISLSMWKAVIQCREFSACKIIERLESAPLLDEDGYPTSHVLRVIEAWNWNYSYFDFFKLIESIWYFKEYGWHEEKDSLKVAYFVSTVGWSGNEAIIRTMEANRFGVWDSVWVQSRRGGHYIFEVLFDKEEDDV